jgi:hypothetical protein
VKVALDEATYVPWGEWVQPTAFRRNVRDVLKFGAPLFWNVKVTQADPGFSSIYWLARDRQFVSIAA